MSVRDPKPTLMTCPDTLSTSLIGGRDQTSKLANLVKGIEGVQHDIRRDENFYDNHWAPYLIANASLPQIYNAGSRVPGFEENFSELIELLERKLAE
jgi:hypothetical protein